jgi:hypothetical protein
LSLFEVYDGDHHVEGFDELQLMHMWYAIKAIRVRFVYDNVADQKLQLFLIDKNVSYYLLTSN